MSEIDWEAFAKMNGMSPEQFKKEIMSVAAVVGAMAIDANDEQDMVMKFTCSDNIGKIMLTIRRVKS